MAIIEINLGGGSLDLLEGSEKSFYITKQIHDLRDLNTRNATFSKTIEIPRTNNNRNLLNRQIVDFGAYDGLPYDYIDCEIRMNGIPILTDGKIKLVSESVTSKTLSIGVFGGVVDFFSRLSNDLIGDLNWNEYDFEWDLTSIASYVNTTEGFLFGQAGWIANDDWAKAQSEGIPSAIQINDPDIRLNGGFMYFKTIIEKILATQPSLIFDFSKLNNEALYNELVLCLPITQLLDNFTAVESNFAVVSSEQTFHDLSIDTNEIKLVFADLIYEAPANFWNVAQNQYDVTLTGYYDINLVLDISYNEFTELGGYTGYYQPDLPTIFHGLELSLHKGSDIIYTKRITEVGEQVNVKLSRYIEGGEAVYLTIKGFGAYGSFGYTGGSFQLKGSTAEKADFIRISEYFPKISQRDFIKEVFKLFNCLPYNDNSGVNIELWEDIPKAEDIDLTPYLDVSKSVDVSGTLSGYAQSNTLQYTENDTVNTPEIGFTFPVLNRALPPKKVIVQSLFSASDQAYSDDYDFASFPVMPMVYTHIKNNITVASGSTGYVTNQESGLQIGDLIFVRNAADTGYQSRRRIVSITTKTAGLVDVAFSETSQNEWDFIRNSKQEIGLRFGRVEDNTSVTVRDGGTQTVMTNMKKVVFDESLKWSGLVSSYYDNLIKTLTKPTLKRAWFKLPMSVYNSINLRQPAYLENKRYYINKIEQYSPNKLCRVELIELKEPLPLAQVNSFTATFETLDLGTVSIGVPVTDDITILNNGGVIEVIDITLQNGTGVSEWSLDVAQVTLGITSSTVVVLTYQAPSETSGIRTVEVKFVDQLGKEIIETVQVNVVD